MTTGQATVLYVKSCNRQGTEDDAREIGLASIDSAQKQALLCITLLVRTNSETSKSAMGVFPKAPDANPVRDAATGYD